MYNSKLINEYLARNLGRSFPNLIYDDEPMIDFATVFIHSFGSRKTVRFLRAREKRLIDWRHEKRRSCEAPKFGERSMTFRALKRVLSGAVCVHTAW